MKKGRLFGVVLVGLLCGCATYQESSQQQSSQQESSHQTDSEDSVNIPVERDLVERSPTEIAERQLAAVVATDVSGDAGAYTFSVTVESLETGCDQYADWWEVVTEEGTLIYRRILAHSHVDEQPFTRSGGPVTIDPDEVVFVRSHMHPTGYQPQAMKGSVDDGFESVRLPDDFALGLADADPLPTGCAF